MASLDNIRDPLSKDEDVSEPKFQRVFVSESYLTDPLDLKSEIEIKEEPEEVEEYSQEYVIDTPLKIEEVQITSVKNETEPMPPQEIETIYLQEEPIQRFLFCTECQQEYEDFCPGCPMLLRVLDNIVKKGMAKRAHLTLPKKLLAFKSGSGVISIKDIPTGVTFGPYEGLESVKMMIGGKYMFKMCFDELWCSKIPEQTNWLQFVNYSENFAQANLVIIQCEGYLYYRSSRRIRKGEELFVYIDKTLHGEYCNPVMIGRLDEVFACIHCCMGFSMRAYLRWHWKLCPQPRIPREILAKTWNETGFPPPPPLVPLSSKPIPEFPVDEKKPTRVYAVKPKVLRCQICKEKFYCPQKLRQHEDKHTAERLRISEIPKQCKKCNKTFPYQDDLEKHAHVHSKRTKVMKLYKCNYCNHMAEKKCVDFVQHMLHKYGG